MFEGLRKLEGQYSNKLLDDAKPFALTVPRIVSIPLISEVKAELDLMEETGEISKINEPTEWCEGMVAVPKPKVICAYVSIKLIGWLFGFNGPLRQ